MGKIMNTLLNTNIYAAALIIIILSYLAGSINGAMIVSLFFGSDIRKKGSKNAGATNVYRHHGFLPALFTALFDFFKGFIPAFYLPGLIYCGKVFTIITFYQESGLIGQGLDSQTAGVIWKLAFLSGLASIAGHIFPLFHSFKGGKGVAVGYRRIYHGAFNS
jgi:glycerol-3-phosphate acyltransferase PlsY